MLKLFLSKSSFYTVGSEFQIVSIKTKTNTWWREIFLFEKLMLNILREVGGARNFLRSRVRWCLVNATTVTSVTPSDVAKDDGKYGDEDLKRKMNKCYDQVWPEHKYKIINGSILTSLLPRNKTLIFLDDFLNSHSRSLTNFASIDRKSHHFRASLSGWWSTMLHKLP